MAIEIRNLTKIFKPENKCALDGVSIKFKENQITGLIGFNGSGKTTIFNILSECIESKKSGEILFHNEKFNLKIKRRISFLTAGWNRNDATIVKKHLILVGKLYGAKLSWIKEKIAYYSKLFKFEEYLLTRIKNLSKGNKQKVKIITSFLNPNCKYMLLDEPFDGLDPVMVQTVKNEYMKLPDTTIIISSHLMEVIDSMVKEFYIIKDGKIVDFKNIENEKIIIRVNKEVSMITIKKLKYVIKIIKKTHHTDILINHIDNFKSINDKLVNLPKYKFSSLIKDNIVDSVFSKYKADN